MWKEYIGIYQQTPLTWQQAENYCINNFNTNLASISSITKENELLFSVNNNNNVWIGLNDIENEGIFVWNDGSDITYTNWENDISPQNDDSLDCYYINQGYWYASDCNTQTKSFVNII